MCELFALNAEGPINTNAYLREFFSHSDLVFRFCHVIKNEFQEKSTAKSASLDLEIGKAHWKVNLLDALYADEGRIFHCRKEPVAFFCLRCIAVKGRIVLSWMGIFSKIPKAYGFVTALSVFASNPAALIAEEFNLILFGL